MSASLTPKCLIFDLETVPQTGSEEEKIIKIGAFRPDTLQDLELKTNKENLLPALSELDSLSEGASFVLGHNILAHDLPILQRQNPDLRLLQLPAIDTLRLSPLAFPQNPYHRLIKNYKLIRDTINSPLADCRATYTLYQDQCLAFDKLAAHDTHELRVYHALIAPIPGPGLGNYMLYLAGEPAPGLTELRKLIPDLLQESDPAVRRTLKVCVTRLQQLLEQDLTNKAMHWPIAYTLAWLRVSGGNSVLAPWVRHQFPAVAKLIHELRDVPCGSSECSYCRSIHDPRHELKRYFGFDHFRSEPRNTQGGSLQEDIVLAGMQGKHVLAILATGGGKSLCYQLPALNRYYRNGGLTIIISPLQSLMKDQVDGLLKRNVHSAAALNGLLTMPERANVLEKIQMGDIGILLVSPEQFRNKAFRNAIEHRQINAWIFDEAHCLSKWGHDFRPDYLYAARFIREFTSHGDLAPIGCFTATAKLEVLDDIRDHFKRELDVQFAEFFGGHERTNLDFSVIQVHRSEKWSATHRLLTDSLEHAPGGAVVFVARRKSAEELAEFLKSQRWACEHFHAGLKPEHKKEIQEAFIAGALRVIVATNAFGMGVDKPDIRLVIHAEIPGSLENYLQEAGRAGRDQHQAECVLLYDPDDIETQFGITERSKLSKTDIDQILKKLRNSAKRVKDGKVIITAGEILSDQYVHTSFEADDRDAETKVATAIAWLERGHFLERNENHTQVFPAKLRFTSMEEAQARLAKADLSDRRRQEYSSVLSILYAAEADERVTTDQLMQHTGLTQDEVTATLRQLEELELLVNDTQITLYVHAGIANGSLQRLERSIKLEKALFSLLREYAADADLGEWQVLNIPELTTRLREETQEEVIPLHVSRLLNALSSDSDDSGKYRGSFELKGYAQDSVKIRIKGMRTWSDIEEMGEKRRLLALKVLDYLLKCVEGQRGKDLLVETTLGSLVGIIESDLELSTIVRPDRRQPAIQHVLLYLHQEEVLALNHGMTVMRRAMTIQVNDEQNRRYQKDDYDPLAEHYSERRIQVHVMREYAEIALKEMADALRLVMHYFTLPKRDFLKRYFSSKKEVLGLATSESSWRKIIDPLNEQQRAIVTDEEDHNQLVLAGPGSGKTRVIVHRVAYLLRVRRIPAQSVIVLTFNRHAANEIRKRLYALVGADAFGLTVLTYHAMAMRLMGVSFKTKDRVDENELAQVIQQAVALLEGSREAMGEDELRDRLLQGYQYILVDEYQDIDDWQYRLVSALAGRNQDPENKLTILAVGDDDQNVYAWRNTSNRYIEQFQQDYQARTAFLVSNYRSTRHIIAAANIVISHCHARLKAERPICIDPLRQATPLGGRWQSLDGERQGKLLLLQLPSDDLGSGNVQCQAVMNELNRLLQLDPGSSWTDGAVLARTHEYLHPFQAWCEHHGIPYVLAADKNNQLPITRQRGFVLAVDRLRALAQQDIATTDAIRVMKDGSDDPEWLTFFDSAAEQLKAEFGDCTLAIPLLVNWLYDYARECRHSGKRGLYLGTVHSAKGLEFKHVAMLDGAWNEASDEERRLFYVGMTRAMETLTLCQFEQHRHPFIKALNGYEMLVRPQAFTPLPQLNLRYHQLSLKEIDLGFAGRHHSADAIHQHLSGLRVGDRLTLQTETSGRCLFINQQGVVVGRSSKAFKLPEHLHESEVAAILLRDKVDQEDQYQSSCKVERWGVIVPRVISMDIQATV
ncbi:RecQ family ATP-dependent DNA helicase [Chitinilyticum aquatile]|uniref:RecQ family ATP-dependent DNA helicase n=1 Tax=Chitinilyticum aquatile TaxID=362520 RepID=UPI0003F8F18C|nr:RecQ family ATP-dependent DNA helicase [Chitinilyticum aquatile]